MASRLMNKKVVMTGASSGIGRAAVELFVNEGAKIALGDINTNDGQEIARILGDEVTKFFYMDVSDETSVQDTIPEAVDWLGGLDILVNNAGVGGVGLPKPLEELTLATWNRTLDTNLKGTFLVSKSCLPYMKAKGGSVINVVSTYSIVGGPQLGAYCASKGGILALTRNMALDYARYKIRVNALAPGFVDTPMLRADINKDPDPEATLRDLLKRIPQNELMTAEQVAKVILFLASDESAIMTGSLVVADGGYTAQ